MSPSQDMSSTSPGTFLIGSSAEHPIVRVDVLSANTVFSPQNVVSLDANQIDRLSPFLQMVPGASVAAEVGGSRYLRVVVDGPLAAAADGNGLRGFTRELDGKFRSHARFYEDDRLKRLVTGGALLQVASTVVAQKHLADISAKLTDIKEGIEKIGEHLKDAREGEITGRLDYLLQIAPYVLNGQSSADVGIRIQLEDCEVKLGAVQNHLEKEIGRLAHRVAKEKDPNLFGTDGLTEILLARQREATPLLEQWNLCMAARMMACHLLSRCEGLHVIAEGRQKTLNRLVQSFLADAGPITTFERAMHNRINGLSSFTDSKMTVHANRIRLSAWKKQKLPSFTEAIGTTCRMVDQLTSEHSRPQLIELDVKVENGRVVEAYSPLVQRTFI
jgi:hypothetical protein